MFDLIRQIELTNERCQLFERGDKILIALSGGPDSIALFHLFSNLAAKYELMLGAAHLNHGLRQASAGDLQFCRALCRAHGRKFHTRKVDVRKIAKRQKIGLEEAGRQARYLFFQSCCQRYNYNKIATGHNADDNAETVLLNMLRGSDLGGLSGIPPRRQNIIRPLIEIDGNRIRKFLKDNKLSFRVDKTNQEVAYRRNLLRNKVFPILEKINPCAVAHIARAALTIRRTFEVFENILDHAYETCLVSESGRQLTLDLAKLPNYYKSLESWVLLRAYFRLAGPEYRPDALKIERVIKLKRYGARAFLGDEVMALKSSTGLVLYRPPALIRRINIKIGRSVRLGDAGLVIISEKTDKFDLRSIRCNDDDNVAYLDSGKLSGLFVRGPKAGDKFRALGMEGTKKVADYLNDKGVPNALKLSVPIVACDSGIAWIAGFGISEDFKVDDDTREVLKLQLISEPKTGENPNP